MDSEGWSTSGEQAFRFGKNGVHPPRGTRKCGKQRTFGRAFWEVWQIKNLEGDFADLWQIQDLAAFLKRVGRCAGGIERTRVAMAIYLSQVYYS